MLTHAQELVYNLTELMPTQYQKDNLEAMLVLFLDALIASLARTLSNEISKCIKSVFKYKSLVNQGHDSHCSPPHIGTSFI